MLKVSMKRSSPLEPPFTSLRALPRSFSNRGSLDLLLLIFEKRSQQLGGNFRITSEVRIFYQLVVNTDDRTGHESSRRQARPYYRGHDDYHRGQTDVRSERY